MVVSKIAKVSVLGASLLLLAACGNSSVNHGTDAATAASLSSSSTSGNVLQNGLGQKLNFLSENNEPLGNITSASVQGSSIYVSLKNPNTGRKALVRVDLDANSKKFVGVNATAAPYMCYDSAVDPCAAMTVPAGYPSAGTVQINCSSPIYFGGDMHGSVNNLTVTNSVRCGF